ncbi:hypothetical protein M3B03_08375 [Corynebacterium pseudodiphtheriticum]|uniref:hypothetical protein n=1 Tax=Corynebacterium pseudodiphtheriticum TaxID=37637 RepID=UPI00223C159D|nr:hypothetical protein [Corynebacterium pseudodiphtheriticum]MCT1635709.1 hypothetical protein [Corynebacterium pseudodiphtheriticum]MCT1666796.1 hypothetical protein [Corynebacterium pseudodiphtheriticum]WKS29489.1 hypothetical protein NLL29_07170 [Corynebacterium pseudodiphtheriticum]WKS50963.1 hypothetical protein NLL37_07435 [Corynebacterium pseudodiphtheriticum]
MKLSRTFTALAATSMLTLAACSNTADSADETVNSATEQASSTVKSATDAAGSAANEAKDAASDAADQKYPDILEAELSGSDGEYRISVTVSSPYDSPERYADGWRVLDEDGTVLAEHELGHDHANEQPFTRSRGPFEIPDNVNEVTVEGHDQEHGYGGKTVTIEVPR